MCRSFWGFLRFCGQNWSLNLIWPINSGWPVSGKETDYSEHCIDPAISTVSQLRKEITTTVNTVSYACFRHIVRLCIYSREEYELLPVIHDIPEFDKSVALGTLIISHDKIKKVRQNCRMDYSLLLSRINERMDALGLSARRTCSLAKVGENTIRNIRAGHAPKPANLHKLAQVLGVPDSYFLEAATQTTRDGNSSTLRKSTFQAVETVYVKGIVQAGVWQDAIEWPAVDWIPVYIPTDSRYPNIERFGLEVRGSSMNKIYPEGSIVIAVRIDDLGRCPHSGERVIVQCRAKKTSDMEATIKRYELTPSGQHILWPESYDPLYQTPIILDDIAEKMGGKNSNSSNDFCDEVKIIAVVVGSYRSE